MFRFTGVLRYATHNSGRFGHDVNVDFSVSFFPGRFNLAIQDEGMGTIHSLTNRRFNFQARDSPEDLLARAKWRTDWYDRFTGTVYLQCPRIAGVPRELSVTVTCSWDPAFCVVAFRLDDTFYQLSCRPPRGVNRWSRSDSRTPLIDPPQPQEIHEPSSGSQYPPSDSSHVSVGSRVPSTPTSPPS